MFTILSKSLVAIGVASAVYYYGFNLQKLENLKSQFKSIYQFVLNKWYFDELYNKVFVNPIYDLGKFLWNKIDQGFIDRFLPNGRALALQERASRRGQQRRDPGDGGVRPVRGAEGIPDEEVPEAREARGQLRVPLGLSRMEPDVLAEHHGPSGRGGDRLLDGRPHALLERDDL